MTRVEPQRGATEVVRTSGSRRSGVGAPTVGRFALIRAAQVRAVGTAFLRARPLVVAPVALVNALVLVRSGAPAAQRMAIGVAIGVAVALFTAESLWLRRARVGERWLATSLVLTSVLLAAGCALSGGVRSPMLPLLLAPVVVAAAAFGRGRLTVASSMLSLALVGGLALLPAGVPFPDIPDPHARVMAVVAFVGLLLLAYAGVAGLVGAYVRSGEVLDRMRLATLDEAASRMRATEQVGAKVAHELKNPLAAIKALLQLLRGGVDDKGRARLEVALAEVDRMDAIVRDYLSFARPLADLRVEPVDLRVLADDVVSLLEGRAGAASVQLAAEGGSTCIAGDARRLREALVNLVDNALAATPAGGRVVVRVVPCSRGAQVAIEDTGAGMPEEIAAAAGTPFLTTRPDGTGLGLTIAQAAVAQHGGTLRFSARPGGGTVAMIDLPDEPGGVLAEVS